MFYFNLAISNIKKSKQTYLPYGIISIFMVSIFYIMIAISQNESISEFSTTLCVILIWGVAITGLFAVIFLFYINSFLMKKRKTELGLYNVLGLNKFHIIKVVFFEKLILSLGIIALGLILGVIFEKLLFLLLLKLIKSAVILGVNISYKILFITIVFFLTLNIVMFLWDAFEIKRSKTIELLDSKKQGEKEPKVKILWILVGAICLGVGYYNSVTIENPVFAMNRFMGSVILVMIGTYALFMFGSIAILKFLKSRKNIYYKINNFISISTMIYRMKRNAVGLANICILSTAVIIAVSTTLSLYMGYEKHFNERYKGDINISLENIEGSQISMVNKLLDNIDIEKNSMNEMTMKNELIDIKGNEFVKVKGWDFDAMLIQIPLSEYNKATNNNLILKDDSALIYYKDGFKSREFYLNKKKYNVKSINKLGTLKYEEGVVPTYIMIVNDSEFKNNLTYDISFNLNKKAEIGIVSSKLNTELSKSKINYRLTEKEVARKDFDALYGGFLFIGILIGIVFLSATILIIYYKQISEGHDDKERFEIMRKVGLDDKEIKGIIKKQVSTVFLSPVIVASIHLLFAYPAIEKMLYLLNLRDAELFRVIIIGTVLVFLVVYILVYQITSRVYYKIVK
ncbi:MAG: FtsX-like permease family protein [Sarcina sp.]